ncbi:hypothetical protein PM082_000409 [Marasmius tenuissimus]|nr:hypothetical protein PM082_000409 [Marasmius tenuissimus]
MPNTSRLDPCTKKYLQTTADMGVRARTMTHMSMHGFHFSCTSTGSLHLQSTFLSIPENPDCRTRSARLQWQIHTSLPSFVLRAVIFLSRRALEFGASHTHDVVLCFAKESHIGSCLLSTDPSLISSLQMATEDALLLQSIRSNLVIKVARIAVETACYGLPRAAILLRRHLRLTTDAPTWVLQAIPIYGGPPSPNALIALEIINAVVQQAMEMYPTAIVVICHLQRSLRDFFEVPSQGIHLPVQASSVNPGREPGMIQFAHPQPDSDMSTSHEEATFSVTGSTTSPPSRHQLPSFLTSSSGVLDNEQGKEDARSSRS